MAGGKAFVVMQVGAEGSAERRRADEVFEYIISPALADFGIDPYRSDQDPSPGPVTPTMLRELLGARLVVADLTGRNPNVFYELRITHSFSRPLVCIADNASGLPFDAKDERVIQIGDYPQSGLTYAQGVKAKNALVQSLKVVLTDDYVAPSPLREVASTRSLDELAATDPLAAELASMREILEDVKVSVGSQVRLAVPPKQLEDLSVLRSFIESVAPLIVDVGDLRQLSTSDTSAAQDRWVNELITKEDARRVALPFGGTPDPWSTPAPVSDEPPF